MRPFIRWAAAAALLAAPATAFPWFDHTHELAAAASVRRLPPDAAAFFEPLSGQIAERVTEPDRERDRVFNTRHWFDIEVIAVYPYRGIPAGYPEACAKYGREALEGRRGSGTLPWAVREEYERLVKAIRLNDREDTVRSSAWLLHFIADLHLPMHATANYDGNLFGVKGIHKRVERLAESRITGAVLQTDDSAAPLAVVTAAEAVPAVVEAAVRSNARNYPLVYHDTLIMKEYPDIPETDYDERMWAKTGPLIEDCLRDAVRMGTELLYSAWCEASAGHPGD